MRKASFMSLFFAFQFKKSAIEATEMIYTALEENSISYRTAKRFKARK